MGKNFKSKVTGNNLELDDETKKSLVQLMVFATRIGELDNNEAMNVIQLAKSWFPKDSMNNLEEGNYIITNVEDLQQLRENSSIKGNDISNCIEILVDILSASDFFDIQNTLKKILDQYSAEYSKLYPETPESTLKKIKFSNMDFNNQFYGDNGTREISDSEKYANLMYLSNQLAHAIGENSELEEKQRNNIKNELFKIKNWSVHKLIEEKKKGTVIDIAIRQDKDYFPGKRNNCLISFSLPNYFEPFTVHGDYHSFSQEELKLCDGEDRFNKLGLKTTFPQYFSNEKIALLNRIMKNQLSFRDSKSWGNKQRLSWFFDTRKLLAESKRRKIKNTPVVEEEKTKRKTKEPNVVRIARENNDTFKKITDTLGITLPQYFKDGFLHKTSYSVNQYMEDVKPTVTEELLKRGIKKEQLDAEMSKLIIFMKVVKPLSIISRKSVNEKTASAIESLDYYSDTYDFIMTNINSTTDFSDLKSKTRRFANSLVQSANLDMESEIVGDNNVQKANDAVSTEETMTHNDNKTRKSSKEKSKLRKDKEVPDTSTKQAKKNRKKRNKKTSEKDSKHLSHEEVETMRKELSDLVEELIKLNYELLEMQKELSKQQKLKEQERALQKKIKKLSSQALNLQEKIRNTEERDK